MSGMTRVLQEDWIRLDGRLCVRAGNASLRYTYMLTTDKANSTPFLLLLKQPENTEALLRSFTTIT